MRYARQHFWRCVTSSPAAWVCLAVCTTGGAAGGVYFSWGHGRGAQTGLTALFTAGGLLLGLFLVLGSLAAAAPLHEMRSNVVALTDRIAELERPRPTVPISMAPKSDLELLGEATRRKEEMVLRADLVYLSDEIAAARRVFVSAVNSGRYWREPIKTSVWEAIKNKHLGAHGFHRPRATISEAYDAIAKVEYARQVQQLAGKAEKKESFLSDSIPPGDRATLDRATHFIIGAENELANYLDTLPK